MSVKDVYYIGNHTVTRPDKNFTHFLEYMHYILYIAIATYIITIYIYIYIYVTEFWKTYHLHTSEIIRISNFSTL